MPGSYRPAPARPPVSGTNNARLPDITLRLQSPRNTLLGQHPTHHEARAQSRAARRSRGRSRAAGKQRAGNTSGGTVTGPVFEPEEGGYEVEGALDERVVAGGNG